MQRFTKLSGDYPARIVVGIATVLMVVTAMVVLYAFPVPGDDGVFLLLILGLLTIWRSHRYHMPKVDPRIQDSASVGTPLDVDPCEIAGGTSTRSTPLEADPPDAGMTRIPNTYSDEEDDGSRTAAIAA